MSRIATVFDELRRQNRKALIPFITAGDPEPAMMVPLMHELVKAGADIIELGVPFSDPMADGPTIQRSSERALKHHVGLKDVLAMVDGIQAKRPHHARRADGLCQPNRGDGVRGIRQRERRSVA